MTLLTVLSDSVNGFFMPGDHRLPKGALGFVVTLWLAVLMSIAGCKSMPMAIPSLSLAASTELPPWVVQPPQSPEALHAVGQGSTLQVAEQRARQSLAAQIQSKTKSQSETYIIQDGNYHNQYHRQQVESQVSELRLTGASLVQSAQQGHEFFALLRLDRDTFVASLNEQLEIEVPRLQAHLNNEVDNGFDRWWQLRGLATLAEGIAAKAFAVKAFSAEQQPAGLLVWQAYQRQLNASLGQRKLRIRNRTGDGNYEQLVSEQLQAQGVSPASPLFGNIAELTLSTNFKTQAIAQEIHVAGELAVVLTASNGAVLARTSWQANGVALDEPAQAQQRASIKLYQKLQRENVLMQLLAAADHQR